jgi:hypothetical protein
LKQCTNCRGNLADFVPLCPYCGVPQPVSQVATAQQDWAPPQSSNKAIASLVCGVLFLCAPASIAAIVLGHLALVDIKRSANRITGHGMAVAGLVMGYVGIALTAFYIIFVVFMVRSTLSRDIPANETAAIATMRTYHQALKAYAAKCPQQGYPATLLPLGPGAGNCTRANLTDARLAVPVPVRKGYLFQYTPGANGSQQVRVFAMVARPVQANLTGKRFFFLDEEGVIRQADSQIIGPGSDPVDTPEAEADQVKEQNLISAIRRNRLETVPELPWESCRLCAGLSLLRGSGRCTARWSGAASLERSAAE